MTTPVAAAQPPAPARPQVYTTECSNCGAPLEVTPDAVGYVCEYCGWTGVVDGVDRKGYSIVKPLSWADNRKFALGFLRNSLGKSFSESQIKDEKFYAIPFWVTDVSAESQVNGYKTRSKTRGSGKNTQTYTVFVPVREVLRNDYGFVQCARKNASFYGLDEIRTRVRGGAVQPLDPLPLLREKLEFLDVEIDEDEDREWAETGAEDEQYRRARSETRELFDCWTKTKVGEPRLVYYPIYQTDYDVQGRVYRTTFDGTSGKVVKAELPVPGYLRAVYAAAAYGLVLTGVLVAGLSLRLPFVVAGVVVAALAGPLAYFATLKQRTKRS